MDHADSHGAEFPSEFLGIPGRKDKYGLANPHDPWSMNETLLDPLPRHGLFDPTDPTEHDVTDSRREGTGRAPHVV